MKLRSYALRLFAAFAVVACVTGGVVAWAAATGDDRDPSPPPRNRDVPGIVSLARPTTPIPVASTPPSALEMRITEPDGAKRAVLAFRETRTSSGRKVDRTCMSPGTEDDLLSTRRPIGNCLHAESGQPWAIMTSASSTGPVSLTGVASRRVTGLTVAGPGGTFRVPTSRSGAFRIVYGARASGRAVLAATLTDGTTRYFRTQVPPTFRPAGVTAAADPEGLPDWYIGAVGRDRGPRQGQTCAQVQQDRAIRAGDPRRQGGTFLAPVCGDLNQDQIFARTVRTAPTPTQTTFGGGRFAPRRTILAGAAAPDVMAVAVNGPDGRRELALADAGRAFLAVYPQRVTPAELTLEMTLADGRVERFPNPVAVNRATTENPPPELVGPPSLRLEAPGSRRVVLRATLNAPARRLEITFLGREVRMRREGGTATRPRYVGIYDGTRGKQRPLRPGSTQRMSVLLCGDVCGTTLWRAGLR